MDLHLLGPQARQLRHRHGVHARHLRGVVEVGTLRLQVDGDGQRLDLRVVQVGEAVLGQQLLGCLRQGRQVGLEVRLWGRLAGLLHELQVLRVEPLAVGARHAVEVPFELQRVAPQLGLPVAAGHHGQALAAAVQSHRVDAAHALDLQRRRGVVAAQAAVEDRRAHDHRRQLAGQADVHAVGLAAAALVGRHRQAGGLADALELRHGLQRHALGHRLPQCRLEQLAVAGAAPAAADLALLGRELRRRHAPGLAGRGQQHGLHARTQLAVLAVAVLHRVGAAGEVHAHAGVDVGAALVAEARAHPRPVGLELLGTDHRQPGLDALAHVHAVAPDGGGAVGRDVHEGLGPLGRVLPRRQARRALAQRRRREGRQRQTAEAGDAGDQEMAARGRGAVLQQQLLEHGGLLQASARAASWTAARMRG
jgi:hypothetical protein